MKFGTTSTIVALSSTLLLPLLLLLLSVSFAAAEDDIDVGADINTSSTTVPITTTAAPSDNPYQYLCDYVHAKRAEITWPAPNLEQLTFDTYASVALQPARPGIVEIDRARPGVPQPVLNFSKYVSSSNMPGDQHQKDLPPVPPPKAGPAPSSPAPPGWFCSNFYLPIQTVLDYNAKTSNPAYMNESLTNDKRPPTFRMRGVSDRRITSAVCVSPRWEKATSTTSSSSGKQQLYFDVASYNRTGALYLSQQIKTSVEEARRAGSSFNWRRTNLEFAPAPRPADKGCAQVLLTLSEYGTLRSGGDLSVFSWTGSLALGSAPACSAAHLQLAEDFPDRTSATAFVAGALATVVPATSFTAMKSENVQFVSVFSRYFDNAAQIAQSQRMATAAASGPVFAAVKTLAQPLSGTKCFQPYSRPTGGEAPTSEPTAPPGVVTLQMLGAVSNGMSFLLSAATVTTWQPSVAAPFSAMPTVVEFTTSGTAVLSISAPLSASTDGSDSTVLFAAVVAPASRPILCGTAALPVCPAYLVYCSVDISTTCKSAVQQKASTLRCVRDAASPIVVPRLDQVRIQTVSPPLENGAHDSEARLTTFVVHAPNTEVQVRTVVPDVAARVLRQNATAFSALQKSGGKLDIGRIEALPTTEDVDLFRFTPFSQKLAGTATTLGGPTRFVGIAPDHQQGSATAASVSSNGSMPSSGMESLGHDAATASITPSADHAFLFSDRVLPPLLQLHNFTVPEQMPLTMRNNSCAAFAIFVTQLSRTKEKLTTLRLCDGFDMALVTAVNGAYSSSGNWRCNTEHSADESKGVPPLGQLVMASVSSWKGYWIFAAERGMLILHLVFLTRTGELRFLEVGFMLNHRERYGCTVPTRGIVASSAKFGAIFPNASSFDGNDHLGGSICKTTVSNISALAPDLAVPRAQINGPNLRGHRLVRFVGLTPAGLGSCYDAYSISLKWCAIMATVEVENIADGSRRVVLQEIVVSAFLGTFEFRHPIFTVRPGAQIVVLPSIPRFLLSATLPVNSSSSSSSNSDSSSFQIRNLYTTETMLATTTPGWNNKETTGRDGYYTLPNPPCYSTEGGANVCSQNIQAASPDGKSTTDVWWFYIIPALTAAGSDPMSVLRNDQTVVPPLGICSGPPKWIFGQKTLRAVALFCFNYRSSTEPGYVDPDRAGIIFRINTDAGAITSSVNFMIPPDLLNYSRPAVGLSDFAYGYQLRSDCLVLFAAPGYTRYVAYSCGAVPNFHWVNITDAQDYDNDPFKMSHIISEPSTFYFARDFDNNDPRGWRLHLGKGRVFYALLDYYDDSRMAYFDYAPAPEPPANSTCTLDDIVTSSLCGDRSWEKMQTLQTVFTPDMTYYADAIMLSWNCSGTMHVTLDQNQIFYLRKKGPIMEWSRIWSKIEGVTQADLRNTIGGICDPVSSRVVLSTHEYALGIVVKDQVAGIPSPSQTAHVSWKFSTKDYPNLGYDHPPRVREDKSICRGLAGNGVDFMTKYSLVPFISYNCDYYAVDIYNGNVRWAIPDALQIYPVQSLVQAGQPRIMQVIAGRDVATMGPGTFTLRAGVFLFYNQIRGRFEMRRADDGRVLAAAGQPTDITLPLSAGFQDANGFFWTDDVYIRGGYMSTQTDDVFALDYREEPLGAEQKIGERASSLFDIVSGLTKLPDSWRRYNYYGDWQYVTCSVMWNTPNELIKEATRRLMQAHKDGRAAAYIAQEGDKVYDYAFPLKGVDPGSATTLLNFSAGCWSEKGLTPEATAARFPPQPDWTFNSSIIDIRAPDGVLAGWLDFVKLPHLTADPFLRSPKFRVLDLSGNPLSADGYSRAPLCNSFIPYKTMDLLFAQDGLRRMLDQGWLLNGKVVKTNLRGNDPYRSVVGNTVNFSRAGPGFRPWVSILDLPCMVCIGLAHTGTTTFIDRSILPAGSVPTPVAHNYGPVTLLVDLDLSHTTNTYSTNVETVLVRFFIMHTLKLRACNLRGNFPTLNQKRIPKYMDVIDMADNPLLGGFLPELSWPALRIFDVSNTSMTVPRTHKTLQMVFYTFSTLTPLYNDELALEELHLANMPQLDGMVSLLDVEYPMPRPLIPTLRLLNVSGSLIAGTVDLRQPSPTFLGGLVALILPGSPNLYKDVPSVKAFTLAAESIVRRPMDPKAIQLICPAYFPEAWLGKQAQSGPAVGRYIPADDFSNRITTLTVTYRVGGDSASSSYTCPGPDQADKYPYTVPLFSDNVLPEINISWDSPIVGSVSGSNLNGSRAQAWCTAHTADGNVPDGEMFDSYGQDVFYDASTNKQSVRGYPLFPFILISGNMTEGGTDSSSLWPQEVCKIPLFWIGKNIDLINRRTTINPYQPAINAVIRPCLEPRLRTLKGKLHKGKFADYSQFIMPSKFPSRTANFTIKNDFDLCLSGVKQWPNAFPDGGFDSLCEPGGKVSFRRETCTMNKMVQERPRLSEACYQGFTGTSGVKIRLHMPAFRSVVQVTRVQDDGAVMFCVLPRPISVLSNNTIFPGRDLFEFARPCLQLAKSKTPVSSKAQFQSVSFNPATGKTEGLTQLNYGPEDFLDFTFVPRPAGVPDASPSFVLRTTPKRTPSADGKGGGGGGGGGGSVNQLHFINATCGPQDFPEINALLCNETPVRPVPDPGPNPEVRLSSWPASYLHARARALLWDSCEDGNIVLGKRASVGGKKGGGGESSGGGSSGSSTAATQSPAGYATLGTCTPISRLFPDVVTPDMDPDTLEVRPSTNSTIGTETCLSTCAVANDRVISMSPLIDTDINVYINCSQVAGKLAYAAKCLMGDSQNPRHPVLLGHALTRGAIEGNLNPKLVAQCLNSSALPAKSIYGDMRTYQGVPSRWLFDVFRLPLSHVGFTPIIDPKPNSFGGNRIYFQTCVPPGVDGSRWLPWANSSDGAFLKDILDAVHTDNESLREGVKLGYKVVEFINSGFVTGGEASGIKPVDIDIVQARSLFYVDTGGGNVNIAGVCDGGRVFSVTPCQPYILPGSNIAPVILTFLATVKDVVLLIIGFTILDRKPVRQLTTRITALIVTKIYPFTEHEAAEWATKAMSRLDPRRIEKNSFWETMVMLFTKDLKEEWETFFYTDVSEYESKTGKSIDGGKSSQKKKGGGGAGVLSKWFPGDDGGASKKGSAGGGGAGSPLMDNDELGDQELLQVRVNERMIENAKRAAEERAESRFSPAGGGAGFGSPNAAATTTASTTVAATPSAAAAAAAAASSGRGSSTPRADEQSLGSQPQEVDRTGGGTSAAAAADPHREKSIAEIALEMAAAEQAAQAVSAPPPPPPKAEEKKSALGGLTSLLSGGGGGKKKNETEAGDGAAEATTKEEEEAAAAKKQKEEEDEEAARAAAIAAHEPYPTYDEESGFILWENLPEGSVRYSSEAEKVLFSIYMEHVCKKRKRLILNPDKRAVRALFAAWLRTLMKHGACNLYCEDRKKLHPEETAALEALWDGSTLESVTTVLDNWEEKLTPQPWLILASMLYCVVNIIILVVDTVPKADSVQGSSWLLYQNIMFVSVNSGASVGILNNAIMRWYFLEAEDKPYKDPLLVGAVVIMAPPLLTHIIFGAVLFAWLPIVVGGVCLLIYRYVVAAIRRRLDHNALTATQSKSNSIIISAAWRNLMVFVSNLTMQMIFNYMMLFYMQQNGDIQGVDGYWSIPVFELDSRSIDCTLSSVAGSLSNAFQLLSNFWV